MNEASCSREIARDMPLDSPFNLLMWGAFWQA
jgi:hypothetical protein